MIEPRIDKVWTQYRESPKLLHILRTMLAQVQAGAVVIDDIFEHFDLETAVGEQLTFIGKVLGWPRTHCVCDVQPVFGFECDGVTGDYLTPITGFCDDNSTWVACDDRGYSEITITDDELYRKFLKVRRYQIQKMYDRWSLTEALRIFWGEKAQVVDDTRRRVVVAPGRRLTPSEEAVIQLYPRVLPIVVGMQLRFHFGISFPVFGFGENWGGFCDPNAGAPVLANENGVVLVNELGYALSTAIGADWMCPVDVKPYDCV